MQQHVRLSILSLIWALGGCADGMEGSQDQAPEAGNDELGVRQLPVVDEETDVALHASWSPASEILDQVNPELTPAPISGTRTPSERVSYALTHPFGAASDRGDVPSSLPTNGVWGNSFQGIAMGKFGGDRTWLFSSYSEFACKDKKRGYLRGWEMHTANSNYDITASLPEVRWEKSLSDINARLGINADHIGDIDYVHNITGGDDLLYLPLEYCKYDKLAPRVAVCRVRSDDDFDCVEDVLLSGIAGPGYSMPWIAFRDGTELSSQCFYTSRYSTDTISEYCDEDSGPGLDLYHRADIPLTAALQSIQGGDHLKTSDHKDYLFLQAQGGPLGSGIYVFERTTTNYTLVDYFYQYRSTGTHGKEDDDDQEFEGFTIGGFDPSGPDNSGQLHSMLRKYNYVGGDSLRFRHWAVEDYLEFAMP